MYCEMLQYLKENCSYSVVQVAASNLLNVIEGSVKDTILYLSESIVNETENFVLDKALDLAITKLLPLAEIVKKGFGGKKKYEMAIKELVHELYTIS